MSGSVGASSGWEGTRVTRAEGGKGRCWLRVPESPGRPFVCMRLRWPVPATGAGLQPWGSYIHVPATEETGLQPAAQQAECLTAAAAGIHLVCMYIHSHEQTSLLLSQPREQDEAASAAYVCVSALSASL